MGKHKYMMGKMHVDMRACVNTIWGKRNEYMMGKTHVYIMVNSNA